MEAFYQFASGNPGLTFFLLVAVLSATGWLLEFLRDFFLELVKAKKR